MHRPRDGRTYEALRGDIGGRETTSLVARVHDQPRGAILDRIMVSMRRWKYSNRCGRVTRTYNVVKALGSTQTRGAHANDKNINVAVEIAMVSERASQRRGNGGRTNQSTGQSPGGRVNIHVSHFECLLRSGK